MRADSMTTCLSDFKFKCLVPSCGWHLCFVGINGTPLKHTVSRNAVSQGCIYIGAFVIGLLEIIAHVCTDAN